MTQTAKGTRAGKHGPLVPLHGETMKRDVPSLPVN
jgi:hypothetical protein